MDEEVLLARQVLHNLEDWDFEFLGHYKLEGKEADKIKAILKKFIEENS